MSSEPFHTITNRDVWNKLVSVESTLNRMDASFSTFNEKLNEHDKRIRSLDLKFYGILAGLIAAIGAGVAVL